MGEEARRTSTVSEAAGEVRWARSVADPTKPWVLQQFWKITEHFADTSARKANPQSGKFTG